MFQLKNVDLVIIDCIFPDKALETLNICTDKISFANTTLFTNEILDTKYDIKIIDKIESLEEYSDFCLKLINYVKSDFVLIVQNDGFILNADLWNNDFLNYDYIGSPWNLTKIPNHRIGNGGFSLRSKKFLEFSSKFETTNGIPEDLFLTMDNYDSAIEFGIKFPPIKLASEFAFDLPNPVVCNFDPKKHFGFHGKENLEVALDYILKK